ncbi:MAG: site-2 protease family protein [Myxococcota bacterium]
MNEWFLSRLVVLVPLILSLSVHEWAHAWMAFRLGDDTAMLQGRLSLDPLVHIDPVGTVLLPLFGVPIGWAKPVPVNPMRFRKVSASLGMALVAAAGPASNLALAMLAFGVHTVLPGGPVRDAVFGMVFLNVALAVFNLLPIPPLDGSRIADHWMPRSLRSTWDSLGTVGPFVLVGLAVFLYFWLSVDY